jgi:hypothetical protein
MINTISTRLNSASCTPFNKFVQLFLDLWTDCAWPFLSFHLLDVYCILHFPHLLGGFLHIYALYIYYICGLWPPDNISCIFMTWYQSPGYGSRMPQLVPSSSTSTSSPALVLVSLSARTASGRWPCMIFADLLKSVPDLEHLRAGEIAIDRVLPMPHRPNLRPVSACPVSRAPPSSVSQLLCPVPTPLVVFRLGRRPPAAALQSPPFRRRPLAAAPWPSFSGLRPPAPSSSGHRPLADLWPLPGSRDGSSTAASISIQLIG